MSPLAIARQGRQLQRYTSSGGRLIVGCIPYRFKINTNDDIAGQTIEVLVVTSQKGNKIMFPKGGWESDETAVEAASREAVEEAGVEGHVEESLGTWEYRSRSNGAVYEGTMYPLSVTEELVYWPEMGARKRMWVSVADVMEGCEHWWMKEALEALVERLSGLTRTPGATLVVKSRSFSQCSSIVVEKALICSCA